MNNLVKNQHYVPQMYLKRFKVPNDGLSVWDLKKTQIYSHQRPENFACERFFYDADERELENSFKELFTVYPEKSKAIDITDKQTMEKALSRMESDLSRVFDTLCENSKLIQDSTVQSKLIIFLHDQSYRSKSFREDYDQLREQFLKFLGELGIDATQVEGMDITGKEYQLFQLAGLSPVLKTANMLLENYSWHMGFVSGKLKLVISDNPTQGVRLGFNDICFPLCGEKAVILRPIDATAPILSNDMPDKDGIIHLSERSVFIYNAIQFSYAERFLFGDGNSLQFLKIVHGLNKK